MCYVSALHVSRKLPVHIWVSDEIFLPPHCFYVGTVLYCTRVSCIHGTLPPAFPVRLIYRAMSSINREHIGRCVVAA